MGRVQPNLPSAREEAPSQKKSDAAYLELRLQAEGPLGRFYLRQVEPLLRPFPGLRPVGQEQWEDPEQGLRLLRGKDQLLVLLSPLAPSLTHLTRRIDRFFEVAFTLAESLSLLVVDPLTGEVLNRRGLQQGWSQIVAVWGRRAAELASARNPLLWTRLGGTDPGLVAPKDSIPVITLESRALSSLTNGVGSQRRLLSLTGTTLRVLDSLSSEAPFLALTAHAEPRGQAWLVRLLRVSRPVQELAILEIEVAARVRLGAVLRDGLGFAFGVVAGLEPLEQDQEATASVELEFDEPTHSSS